MGTSPPKSSEQIFNNIAFELESLQQYLKIQEDDSVLFMIGQVSTEEGIHVLNALMGEYKSSVKLLAEQMSSTPEIERFIFDTIKYYMLHSSTSSIIEIGDSEALIDIEKIAAILKRKGGTNTKTN